MSEILIFGGTTEGRELFEYCAKNGIGADICVATEYGGELLGSAVNVFVGRLDKNEITDLITKNNYVKIIDATHPYAVLATENIRSACDSAGVKYCRLIREKSAAASGFSGSLDEAVAYLNTSDKTVLSTIGSKELLQLTAVNDYRNRMWLRVLPADGIEDHCESFGFDRNKVILGKGPFSVEENIAHIKQSRAEILLTKDSGKAGGYPEKIKAAELSGIEVVTVERPKEKGYTLTEIMELLP